MQYLNGVSNGKLMNNFERYIIDITHFMKAFYVHGYVKC